MSALLLLPLPENEAMARLLAAKLGAEIGGVETRHFPDGETYLKLDADVGDRAVAIISTLDRPDPKILPLLFAADAARDLGARSVGLVAPYLAYMRQDRRFHAGEAVSSRSFARLLSNAFDWLVTIDPHLHRYESLAELYAIPSRTPHAAPLLAEWISSHVEAPMLVGPDAESAQWVSEAARQIGAPFTVLEKTRHGDRDVEVELKSPAALAGRTPVLVDDIISSGETMLAAARVILAQSTIRPVCVAVHGIFAEHAFDAFADNELRVVTCNTVPHRTNAIDVSGLLAEAIRGAICALQAPAKAISST